MPERDRKDAAINPIVKDTPRAEAPDFRNPPSETGNLPEGQVMCHRMYIPSTIVTPGPVNPLTRIPSADIKQNLAYTKCIERHCAIWDDDAKMCSDKSKVVALKKIAEYADARLNDVFNPQGGD